MTLGGWRRLCALLTAACALLVWRDCQRAPARAGDTAAAADDERPLRRARGGDGRARADDERGGRAGDRGRGPDGADGAEDDGPAWSVSAPAWVMWLAPQPGEELLQYRDRIVPLAQAAVAPHRSRVARGRDDFAAVAGLDGSQRAALERAVEDAAGEIQDRLMTAALGGELLPATFKPATGVALARDVLDAVDRAQRGFTAALREDQRAALARHPFDVADYLLFSTRWEDMLGATTR
ncbi:MAG: hypothetical protein KJZ91_28980 [Myxococcales bacterium]|nr:hypothetical protein [Myxococcales bacterium]